jgi:tripartite-type tricarboxylate transporter receptor subunit TctC
VPTLNLRDARAATGYPNQPVRMVVPFPPGSITDTVTRGLSRQLQDELGVTFVTENKPGGQTTIGTSHVAQSTPNGYTLLVAALSFVSAPSEFKQLAFDPVSDFEPIALLGTFPIVLMVREDFPANTVQEFIELAKKSSKPLSAGYGSASTRIAANRFAQETGLKVTEVPYKGIPNAVTDLIGGFIDFTFVDISNALRQAEGGRLKALGVTSLEPSPSAPNWPPIANVIPGFEITAWLAVLAPAKTDPVIVERLNSAIQKSLVSPAMAQTLSAASMTPPTVALPQLKGFIADEVSKWSERYKDAGIEPK